jgi:hypothetical protein
MTARRDLSIGGPNRSKTGSHHHPTISGDPVRDRNATSHQAGLDSYQAQLKIPRAAKRSIASWLGERSTASEEIVASILKRRSEAILNVYEKWGWLAVKVVWAIALLFAATLVLITLGTLVIYPFAGTEENTSVALLVGGILLVSIVVLGFTMRSRFPMKS